MLAVGNPYDNAKAERCFTTRKRGEEDLPSDQPFHEAEENLGRYIGDVSNANRLHFRLGSLPPIEFEDDDAMTMSG